jgi:hypothetical protein
MCFLWLIFYDPTCSSEASYFDILLEKACATGLLGVPESPWQGAGVCSQVAADCLLQSCTRGPSKPATQASVHPVSLRYHAPASLQPTVSVPARQASCFARLAESISPGAARGPAHMTRVEPDTIFFTQPARSRVPSLELVALRAKNARTALAQGLIP